MGGGEESVGGGRGEDKTDQEKKLLRREPGKVCVQVWREDVTSKLTHSGFGSKLDFLLGKKCWCLTRRNFQSIGPLGRCFL